MRAQPFLNWLKTNYNPATAAAIAGSTNIRGGWEAWLQIEIARTYAINESQICDREIAYPDGENLYIGYDRQTGQARGGVANANHAARADFLMYRRVQDAIQDATFIELKCSTIGTEAGARDAWARFTTDVNKVSAIQGVNRNLNTFALLAYWGTLREWPQGAYVGSRLDWYWSGGHTAYVWDTVPILNPLDPLPPIPTLEAYWGQIHDYDRQQPRLIFIALGMQ
jgi:hypothetical protein